MRKISYKILILSVPFVIIALIIFYIDPYNYWNLSNSNDTQRKIGISKSLNEVLWNLLDYRNSKCENILLGDSRMEAVHDDILKNVCNENYYNLGFGAANGNEIITTLEYLIDTYKLKNIIIGINLDQYNFSNNRERISGVVRLINNPFLYVTNLNVLEATYYLLINKITQKNNIIQTTPDISKEEFWNYQIKISGVRYFSNYIYPEDYYNRFLKIKSKCKEKNINIKIIIFPEHSDLNKLVKMYNLKDYEIKFINDMKSIGDVYDFNFDNEITTNKDNFKDPFHCTAEIDKKIMEIVWNKDTTGINKIYKFNKSY